MTEILEQQQKDKSKILNINEDEILRNLSPEDLERLNFEIMEMDPDNCMLPAGMRQPDQTKKEPTGPLDNEKLQEYLVKEAESIEDKEDFVPHVPGVKRGKVWKPKESNKDDGFGGGNIKLDAELEDALANATECELTDLAAILGLHTMMDNEQYYNSLQAGDKIINTVGYTQATKCKLPVCDPSEILNVPKNDTNVDETLQLLKQNDPSLTKVNLNNIPNIPISVMKDLAGALASNTNVTEFSLAGTKTNDIIVKHFAEALKTNNTLVTLNLETNYLSPKGVAEILVTLTESNNTSLQNLKIDNQKREFGTGGEQLLANLLDKNTSLVKFSLEWKYPTPRNLAIGALTRNSDRIFRQKRK